MFFLSNVPIWFFQWPSMSSSSSVWFPVNVDLLTTPLLLTLNCLIRFNTYKSCPLHLTKFWCVFLVNVVVFFEFAIMFPTCCCDLRPSSTVPECPIWGKQVCASPAGSHRDCIAVPTVRKIKSFTTQVDRSVWAILNQTEIDLKGQTCLAAGHRNRTNCCKTFRV